MTEPDSRLRSVVTALHRRVLAFTHRCWFPDVTNQTQGQELFDLWRRHLNTQAAFDQLVREVAESHALLEMQAQGKASDAALRLNVLAAVGLVFALTTGALGMNVLAEGKWWIEADKPNGWYELAAVFLFFAAMMGVAYGLSAGRRLGAWLIPGATVLCAAAAVAAGYLLKAP